MVRRSNITREPRQRETLLDLAQHHASGVRVGRYPTRAEEAMHALHRMETDSYGVCVDCEEPIPAARLRAKPEALRCIACQREYENTCQRKHEDAC